MKRRADTHSFDMAKFSPRAQRIYKACVKDPALKVELRQLLMRSGKLKNNYGPDGTKLMRELIAQGVDASEVSARVAKHCRRRGRRIDLVALRYSVRQYAMSFKRSGQFDPRKCKDHPTRVEAARRLGRKKIREERR